VAPHAKYSIVKMYRSSSSSNNRKVISKSIDGSIRKGKEESENAEEGGGRW
jgi:hypothetical protein